MSALDDEVSAALKRIEAQDRELADERKKAVGFAVFPSVGRAGLVLGGAYGKGLAFEGDHSIGEVSIGQVTIGLQLGGQTFSLVIIFRTKEALERLKEGRIAFTANASAAMVKAAASGTSDYEKDVIAKAYSLGGMLLEASIGGQGLSFKPHQPQGSSTPENQKKAG